MPKELNNAAEIDTVDTAAATDTSDTSAELDSGVLVGDFFDDDSDEGGDDQGEANDSNVGDDESGKNDGSDGEDDDSDSDDGDDGDEEGEDKDDGEDEGEDKDLSDETYTVKVNGEEKEVTLADLVENFQKGEAFTQKTQAHAEEVRAYEAARDKEVAVIKESLQYWALPTSKEPVMADYQGRPEQFMADFSKWKSTTERQAQAASLLKQINADEAQRAANREADLIQKAAPEWSDPEIRKRDFDRIFKFAGEKYGVDQEEVLNISDHRILLLLRDASKVAELEAKPIITKRKKAPTRMKPGSRLKVDDNGKKSKEAIDRVAKGIASDDDRVGVFFNDS